MVFESLSIISLTVPYGQQRNCEYNFWMQQKLAICKKREGNGFFGNIFFDNILSENLKKNFILWKGNTKFIF